MAAVAWKARKQRTKKQLSMHTKPPSLLACCLILVMGTLYPAAQAACVGLQVNPEKAAKHAAAAARKALEAAQHAHRAAMYAGLLPKGAHEAEPWHNAGRCEPPSLAW